MVRPGDSHGTPSIGDRVNDGEPVEEAEYIEISGFTVSAVEPITNQALPEQQPKQKKKKGSGARSLKTLARVKLGRDIQLKEHDSIEDAVATRDLVDWFVINGPSIA